MAAISALFPSDNFFVKGILVGLAFVSLFLIGAFSYLVFRRLTRVEYIDTESERWLAERREANPSRVRLRKILKRLALWIPTVTVVLARLFFDSICGFATHLLHPGRGSLTE